MRDKSQIIAGITTSPVQKAPSAEGQRSAPIPRAMLGPNLCGGPTARTYSSLGQRPRLGIVRVTRAEGPAQDFDEPVVSPYRVQGGCLGPGVKVLAFPGAFLRQSWVDDPMDWSNPSGDTLG